MPWPRQTVRLIARNRNEARNDCRMRNKIKRPWDGVTEAIDQPPPVCDEPCISCAGTVRGIVGLDQ